MSEKQNERQKDSVYSKRYDDKRQAVAIQIKLYADDDDELQIIEYFESLKLKKQSVKSVIKQLLLKEIKNKLE